TVSLTWTTEPEGTTGFPQRGSGYNYNNGTSFIRQGDQNGARVDNFRAGWPSIGILPNGQEWIIAHDATNGGFRMSKNDSKGSNNWTTGSPILTYPDKQRPIWNRAANNGNTIHLICNFSDSSSPGDPRVITLNGVRGPMMYSRSQDGGTTWDKQNTLLPGYDSTRIVSGGGDNYAIDVNGNTVAIVVGGLAEDVILWKSNDNGETFTRTIVDSFPYSPFRGLSLATDTPYCNDGSLDVLIDNNGDCHVFYGMSRVFDDDTTDDGAYNFFPATALLSHWSEASGVTQFIAGVVDEIDPGVLNIERGTYSGLINRQLPNGLDNVARTGNTGLVTMPSAGVDAQGRIFVTYSAPRENDLSIDNTNCRDVYVVYSTDGGATWSTPQNISQVQYTEDAFPAMARRVDDFVHVVWQQDENPGTNLQNNAEGGNNQSVSENKIMYAAVPVSKLINNEIGQGPGVGMQEITGVSEIFRVSQNYPNPFSNETAVTVYMTEASEVKLTVTNLMGQVVIQQNLGQFLPGNSVINIDANGLSAGIYTYTLSTNSHEVGNKMIVK
ncbi:MAG: T9SS type A sorting domain-containing protein, partial [Bacteroidota bacterium]|nr:T9SS type A sorting domain-containing protein [Bacteroidota bacterium]MDX5431811.1 T9SS type A sorting domain-containing protein [Bacteroidota bacterium]MDX5470522.1 T9SS type A sorting domain-containing protein [Bacteroidota bacterium]